VFRDVCLLIYNGKGNQEDCHFIGELWWQKCLLTTWQYGKVVLPDPAPTEASGAAPGSPDR